MKTDPLSDAWDFLVGAQPDQVALGDLRWLFVGLFAFLIVASGVIALAAWRRQGGEPASGPFWAWLIRAMIGIMWFQGALWKLPFPVAPGLRYWTEQMVDNAAWPWFGWFVDAMVLPNLVIVDPLVCAAEMGLAISLLLGLFVRPVASLGAIYAIGLWIGLYRHPGEWPWEYIFLAAAQAMSAVVGGRYSLGLDALLAPLWQRSLDRPSQSPGRIAR